MTLRFAISSILMLAIAGAAQGQLPTQPNPKELVKLDVAADVTSLGAGETAHLLFRFTMKPHWHIYWVNAGEGGAPTEIEVTAPDGFEVGEIMWPRPMVIETPEGTSFGYEDDATIIVPITAPKTLDATSVELSASLMWLVCKDVCMMGMTDRTIELALGAHEPIESEEVAGVLALIPETFDVEKERVTFDGTTLVIRGDAKDFTDVGFLPIERPGITYEDAEIKVTRGRYEIVVPVDVNPGNALGEPLAIAGLITLGPDLDDPSFTLTLPLETPAP